MKRNKEWWSIFTREERYKIWNFEHFQNVYYGNDGYMPDDCSECAVCGDPCFGGSSCTSCINEYQAILEKYYPIKR